MGLGRALKRAKPHSSRWPSLQCEGCWLGRAVAGLAVGLWVLIEQMVWHAPGEPGTGEWQLWVWLIALTAGMLSLTLGIGSFFMGCAQCRR